MAGNASYQFDPSETGPARNGDPLGRTPDMAEASDGVGGGAGATGPDDEALRKKGLEIVTQAESTHRETSGARYAAWQRAHRAYRNEHFSGSKYLTPQYRDRSRGFVPKTRGALRKDQAAMMAALFNNTDVLDISAEDDDDPAQLASADLKSEIVNYRLDRGSNRGGIPWFIICMGAVLTADLTGIVVSKQDWEYEEEEEEVEQPAMEPMIEPGTGLPIAGNDGQPVMMQAIDENGRPVTETVTQVKVTVDKPMIYLHPSENIIIDPGAAWYDPAQKAGYIILRHPMTIAAAKEMIADTQDKKRRIKWKKNIKDVDLKKAATAYDAKGVRIARDGQDAIETAKTGDYSTVWVNEVYARIHGCEYTYWTIGQSLYLSEIQRTKEVYPWARGARPLAVGYGAIEPHRVFPMSKAESLQMTQQEINDVRNLRLDAMKQSVLPFAKVKFGRNVDVAALKSVSPGSYIYVQDMADLEFSEAPNQNQSAVVESTFLNADFDDLAGVFSGSSVQTNRALNETVGGMRMLNGNSAAITEYDLRVIVETWAEVALRQVVHLEEYFEDDITVLGLAGKKAQIEKYGVNEITDELLEREVTVRINVGQGATDPLGKIEKINAISDALLKVAPMIADPKPSLDAEEWVSEIFGAAGWKDGKRFFKWPDPNQPPPPPPPDPNAAKAQADAEVQKQKLAQDDNNQQMRLRLDAAKAVDDTKIKRDSMALDAAHKAQSLAIERKKAEDASAAKAAELAHQRDMAAQDAATRKTDFGLRLAAHNKQLTDEQSLASDTPGSTVSDRLAVMEQEMSANTEGLLQRIDALIHAMIAGQAKIAEGQDQSRQQIAAALVQQGQEIEKMLAMIAAPKELVRGPDGKATGVRIAEIG